MTTITQKKHYKTPHCVFVSLEEETSVLSGSTQSIEEEIHESQPIVFGLVNSSYGSQDAVNSTGSKSIWDSANNFD